MSTTSTLNWRTINIDALDPDSATNFDIASLLPADSSSTTTPPSASEIRQLLRSGDSEGALRTALEGAPYGAGEDVKEAHLSTILETLQSIKASEMGPLIARIYASPQGQGGPETLDVLMKYLYKGMAQQSGSSGGSGGSSTGKGMMTPQATGGGFSQIGGGRGGADGAGGGGGGGGQAMSVLLSWHERVVEVAGLGSVVRVMTDRRTV